MMGRALAGCFAFVVSCAPRTVDLGGDAQDAIVVEGGTESGTNAMLGGPMSYGCVDLDDPKIDALRNPICPSACSSGPTGPLSAARNCGSSASTAGRAR